MSRLWWLPMLLFGALLLGGCLAPIRREAATLPPRVPSDAPAEASAGSSSGVPADVALSADAELTNQPSVLSVTGIGEFSVGAPISITAELKNADDRPQPNKVLVISIDGNQVRRVRTDDNGRASLYLGRDLPVGEHIVRVESIATRAYRSAAVEEKVTVRPAELRLTTVPPLPNIGFLFDGRTYYTDANGVAVAEAAQPGTYSLEMLPAPQITGTNPVQVSFARWADNVFEPRRTVDLQGDDEIFVGLTRSYPIDLAFIDRQGQPVDTSRIMSVTIKSSHGTRYVFGPDEVEWRTANRIARLRNGLEATVVQYGIESVYVDGANVVNQNQQRFTVDGKATWTVQLLLYSARVRAKDALFGFPLGTGANLHYPDGSQRYIPFDANNELVIDNLARGLYRLQVVGASGMAPLTPVSISRDQDVELKVLSTLDLSLAAAFGILLALGLLIVGRPGPFLWALRLPGRLFDRRSSRTGRTADGLMPEQAQLYTDTDNVLLPQRRL